MLRRKEVIITFVFIILLTSMVSELELINCLPFDNMTNKYNSLQANTFNLKRIGHFTGGQEIVNVFVYNNIAYLSDQVEGMIIVNVSNHESPIQINQFQVGGESVYDVKVRKNIAFIAHGNAGLKIIDVADPHNIVEKGEFDNGGIVWKVFLKDNLLFVVDRTQGLEILNIEDIENPVLLGVYECQPFDVYVEEKFAYVAAGLNKGIEVVDISKPEFPKKISELDFDRNDTVGISVSNKYAYVANKDNGMKIVSLARPRNLRTVFEYYDNTSNGRTWGVYTQDDFVYLASDLVGLEVLDVTDPTNPHRIGAYRSSSEVRSFNVFVNNSLIFLASFNSGLEIITWKIAPPKPMKDNYMRLDNRTFTFSHSEGPFIADVFIGNETLGMNLSLTLDFGLTSVINITIDTPIKIKPGEVSNIKFGITGENSTFWGSFDGAVKFYTEFGETPVLTFSDLGVPNNIDLVNFQTFIGEEIVQEQQLTSIVLLEESFLNYTYAFIMTPIFNVTGSSTVSAETSNENNQFLFTWTSDGEQIIIPITIPEDAKDTYGLQIEEFYFNIDELKVDLEKIRFDFIIAGVLPIASWEINISDFLTPPTSITNQDPNILYPNQPTNQTILFLNGIYPMGDFIILLSLSHDLSIWITILLLLSALIIIILPWIIIFTRTRRKNKTMMIL